MQFRSNLVLCMTFIDHLATQLLDIIKSHSEWASFIIGLTAFGESFLLLSLLFPGTAILVAAGTLIAEGTLNAAAIVTAGIIGAVLGDAVSFWLGKKFGGLLPKLWPLRGHPERLDRGVDFFARYGVVSVFIGRFFGPLRAVVPTAAGVMQMPTWRFYVANVLSAIIWVPALVFSGALLTRLLEGKNAETKALVAALIVGALAMALYWMRRQRQSHRATRSPSTDFFC
jgi:membrane protein DedA with SNARE-associated domain